MAPEWMVAIYRPILQWGPPLDEGLGVRWTGLHFFFSFELSYLKAAKKSSLAGVPELGTKTSCLPHFHCAIWSCVVFSDSPRHRIESGRHWPVKSPPRKNDFPARSAKPGGSTAATVVLPPRTSPRASSRARPFTSSAASAASAAITLRETSLLSRSTTATEIFDGGRSSATPPKIYPKNDAITMGATKLIVTARLS